MGTLGRLSLILFFLCGTEPVRAMPESELAGDGWRKVLAPFLRTGIPVDFQGKDGLPLRGVRFPNAKATESVLFLPGFSEPWLKYIELLHDLHRRGYEILSYDHRGQGSSPRLSRSNPDSVHLDRFENHVSDLERFLEKWKDRRVHVLAHSMGGAIALAAIEDQAALPVSRVIVNAPMLAIRTDPFPRTIARGLTSFLVAIGLGEHYAPTKGPRDPARPFEENRGTSSPLRYAFEQSLARSHPERWVGGPTNSWVKAALAASSRIARDPERIRHPVMMIIPTEDHYAIPDELIGICRNLREKCRAYVLPGSRHEVFVETDRYREQALDAVLRSLKDPSENPIHERK